MRIIRASAILVLFGVAGLGCSHSAQPKAHTAKREDCAQRKNSHRHSTDAEPQRDSIAADAQSAPNAAQTLQTVAEPSSKDKAPHKVHPDAAKLVALYKQGQTLALESWAKNRERIYYGRIVALQLIYAGRFGDKCSLKMTTKHQRLLEKLYVEYATSGAGSDQEPSFDELAEDWIAACGTDSKCRDAFYQGYLVDTAADCGEPWAMLALFEAAMRSDGIVADNLCMYQINTIVRHHPVLSLTVISRMDPPTSARALETMAFCTGADRLECRELNQWIQRLEHVRLANPHVRRLQQTLIKRLKSDAMECYPRSEQG